MQAATCAEELDAPAVLLTSAALPEGPVERLPGRCSKQPLFTLPLAAIVLLEFGADSACRGHGGEEGVLQLTASQARETPLVFPGKSLGGCVAYTSSSSKKTTNISLTTSH